MSCEHITEELPLYFYGELSQEEEERVEQHLEHCSGCAVELERVRRFGRAMSFAEMPVTEGLLAECRIDLARAVRTERAVRADPSQSTFQRCITGVHEFMNMHVGFRVPAGALALVAVGFLAGKVAPGTLPFLSSLQTGGSQQAGFVNIRSVEPDASGKVRIAFDNVSRGTVSGSLSDPKVRELLLASMKDESNPGLRVEAAGFIKDHADDGEVRSALLDAVQHDPNVGVRMNALEGLKRYGDDDAVRKAMTQVLLNDANPGVRVKAIDLLTAHKDVSIVGPLQNAMQKEENNYVRMRMTKVLKDLNASVGTF